MFFIAKKLKIKHHELIGESKNEYPDYISTINQLCEIIGKIEDKYLLENDSNNEKERLINSIYKTMRKEDHKI